MTVIWLAHILSQADHRLNHVEPGGETAPHAAWVHRPTPVVPDYWYSLECLTFELLCILVSDDFALFHASPNEGVYDAIRLLSFDGLRHFALPFPPIAATGKHGPPTSAGRLSTNRQAT